MKRYIDTGIFEEDWFIDLSPTEKLFFIFLFCRCNHAGIFKVNIKMFNIAVGDIDLKLFLQNVNKGKSRVHVLDNGDYLLSKFFVTQQGTTLNVNNRVHDSIHKIYKSHNIKISDVTGIMDIVHKHGSLEKIRKEIKEDKEVEAVVPVPDPVVVAPEFPKSEDEALSKFDELLTDVLSTRDYIEMLARKVKTTPEEINSFIKRNMLEFRACGDIYRTRIDYLNHLRHLANKQFIMKGSGSDTQIRQDSDFN